jgi:hypothetical protein
MEALWAGPGEVQQAEAAQPREARVAQAPAPQPVARPVPPPTSPLEEPAGAVEAGADAMPEEAYASDVEVVQRPAAGPRAPLEYARASDPAPKAPVEIPDPAPQAATQPEPEPVAPAPAPVTASPKPAPPPVAASPVPAPEAPQVAAPPKPAPEPQVVARTEPPAPKEPAKPASGGSDLRVERTQWHPSASRRVAFVALGDADARRVEEGDRVGDYVVSEIEVTGVVFLRDGSLITRKVGAR